MRTQMKDGAGDQKSRVKVGKLRVNKEIVEDLTNKEAEQIKGGAMADTTCTVYYSYCKCPKPNPY